MTIERGQCLIVGTLVSTSVLLAWLHSPYWLWLTMFVGLNLFQSGVTNWCPIVWLLSRAGLKPCGVGTK
jgi:hypothetical protein